jgi:hypothetical protein
MNHTIRLALAAAATLWSLGAPAALENVENAYETDTARASLPANAGGQVVIRECASCKSVVLRVDRNTRYFIGTPGAAGQPLPLAKLRAAVAAAAGTERMLTVFYDLETGFVTRIVLAGN